MASRESVTESLAHHLAYESAESGFIWHNFSVSSILRACSGSVANGQLAGILGPSGCGKTTFLLALAGLLDDRNVQGFAGAFEKTCETTCLRTIPSRSVAFLRDTDAFFTHLTVRETLHLAHFLESPQLSLSDRLCSVQQSARQLGLEEALNRRIGDPSSQSASYNHHHLRKYMSLWDEEGRLSHGERRRLSIGLELLSSKQLLLADEPTTGLDSSLSQTVVQILKQMAKSHHLPAILSLHQPRSSIWNNLDYVMLLTPGGRVCYAGCRDDVVEYFEKQLQCKLPKYTNPAEWLVDQVSIAAENSEQSEVDLQRIEKISTNFEKMQRQTWDKSKNPGLKQSIHFQRAGFENMEQKFLLTLYIRRLGALFLRSWRQNVRDITLNAVRFLYSVSMAFLLAAIFPGVNELALTASSIADRVSLLSFGAICFCMMSYIKAVTLFAREKPIVQREHEREQYSMAEYLIAKVFAEIPLDALFSTMFTTTLKYCTELHISWGKLAGTFALLTAAGAAIGFFVGSIAPSSENASTSGIPILVVLMAIGTINPNGMANALSTEELSFPKIVRWLRPTSPFAYAIEALCFGELYGVKFEHGNRSWKRILLFWNPWKNIRQEIAKSVANVMDGEEAIKLLGLRSSSYQDAMIHLGIVAIAYMLLCWCLLSYGLERRRLHRVRPSPSYSF